MFLFSNNEKHSRSIAKALSWRIVGSVDTFLPSYFFTRSFGAAGAIASTEVITKIMLYYIHERAWANFGRGLSVDAPSTDPSSATRTDG